jgi:hypothetical protein
MTGKEYQKKRSSITKSGFHEEERMPKEIYVCENCEQKFDNLYQCTQHEIDCLNEEATVRLNFEKAIQKLVEEYSITILEKRAELYTNDLDGFIQKNVDITLKGILPNKNEVYYDDSYWSAEKTGVNDFYKELEEFAIIPKLETVYEGEIWGSRGYESDFIVGNIEISEICRRLYGKKVRIEVID